MNPFMKASRRRPQTVLSAESLEGRELMTAGAGNTFAILPGDVTNAGGTAAVKFTIDSNNFQLPKNRITLGVDLAPASNSSVQPSISSIAPASSGVTTAAVHRHAGHVRLMRSGPASGGASLAVVAPLNVRVNPAASGVEYQVDVKASAKTSGKFLVGLYLPGDADGNGKVEQADVAKIKSELGAVAGSSKYTFDADSNRDGRISIVDLVLAKRNLGVETTIAPLMTANLDPATDTGAADRVTAIRDVRFTGVASGDSTVTFTEINQKTPTVTTQSAADGSYSISLPLGLGLNQFKVSMTDSSGQTINGQIDGVTYNPLLAVLDPQSNQTGKSGS